MTCMDPTYVKTISLGWTHNFSSQYQSNSLRIPDIYSVHESVPTAEGGWIAHWAFRGETKPKGWLRKLAKGGVWHCPPSFRGLSTRLPPFLHHQEHKVSWLTPDVKGRLDLKRIVCIGNCHVLQNPMCQLQGYFLVFVNPQITIGLPSRDPNGQLPVRAIQDFKWQLSRVYCVLRTERRNAFICSRRLRSSPHWL